MRPKEQLEFNQIVVSDVTGHVNTNLNFGYLENNCLNLNLFVNNTFEKHLNKKEFLCTLNGERETNLFSKFSGDLSRHEDIDEFKLLARKLECLITSLVPEKFFINSPKNPEISYVEPRKLKCF